VLHRFESWIDGDGDGEGVLCLTVSTLDGVES
jgi:hypothetical protein